MIVWQKCNVKDFKRVHLDEVLQCSVCDCMWVKGGGFLLSPLDSF